MNPARLPPELDAPRAQLEEELRRSVTGEDPLLAEVSTHLINAGGHRWRPTLGMLATMAAGVQIGPEVISGACAVELVHLGSLYHDDVMDEATMRRGVVSVNARWGNLIAILAGDFLLARASEIAASLGTEVAGLLAHTIGRLCEGQLLEIKAAFQVTRSEDAYFASIDGKTASLMAASCRIGAICAGLPRDKIETLTAYGEAFGTVFQIVDDVCDLVMSTAELGKPTGRDMAEGVYTLPVIRALALPDVGGQLRDLLDHPADEAELEKARQLVVRSGAVESTIASAHEWADRAASHLRGFGENGAVAAMRHLGHSLLDVLPN